MQVNDVPAYDYIVVGGGSAGCVLANRLSANPKSRVLLIEAGPPDSTPFARIMTRIPAGIAALLRGDRYNYQFHYEPEARLGNKPIAIPRGRIFGGTSSINGMVYMRGHRMDFDRWQDMGNDGWGYEDVLPHFMRSERWHGAPSAFHGVDGELDISPPQDPHPICEDFITAAESLQYRRNDDFNGAVQDGFGVFQLTQRRGERVSAARAFIDPIRTRANLDIWVNSRVRRILFDERRAAGLEIDCGDRRVQVRAGREIILSAGAIHSPQLLMVSGIGPAAHLREHGIDVVHDLAGVGRNLQDHPNVRMIYSSSSSTLYGLSLKALPWMIKAPFQYLVGRRGPFSSNLVEACGYVRTRPDLEQPDLQICIAPGLLDESGDAIPRGHGFSFNITLMQSSSSGHLELESSDIAAKPVMHANFLREENEVQSLMAGVHIARRLAAAPAMAMYEGREMRPGAEADTPESLRAFVMSTVNTAFHPTSTCKMGPDSADSVVDSRLRVHGIQGLRIADASIMPFVISGNTNAPTMMIAEKAASMLQE